MSPCPGKPAKRLSREKRREAILGAASALFYEKGYRGTGLAAIIRRAGGSKRSLYAEFGGKEGLFKALVSRDIERLAAEHTPESADDVDLRPALAEAARRILMGFTDPGLIGLYRVAMLDGLDFPGLAEAFFAAVPGREEKNVARLLEKAAPAGERAAPDYYAEAACFFVGMLHRRMFFELLLGIRAELTKEETESFIAATVSLFLEGLGAAGEKS